MARLFARCRYVPRDTLAYSPAISLYSRFVMNGCMTDEILGPSLFALVFASSCQIPSLLDSSNDKVGSVTRRFLTLLTNPPLPLPFDSTVVLSFCTSCVSVYML